MEKRSFWKRIKSWRKGWLDSRAFKRALPARHTALERECAKLASDRAVVYRHREHLSAKLLLAKARIAELEAPIGAAVPGLTAAEVERLAMLAEECGHVAGAIGKALRYGWDAQSPYSGKPNRVVMERELGELRAVMGLVIDAGDVRYKEVQSWQRSKNESLHEWTHHQGEEVGVRER